MRALLFIGLLAMGACSDQGATAQPTTVPIVQIQSNWTVDKTKSSVSFTAMMNGDSFTGSFSTFETQIKFNADDLPNSKVIATIDMNSADAGDKDRNDALPGKEWFFVKSFPKARFETTGFTHLGGDKYEAAANLTMRGTEKQTILPFTLTIENSHAVMAGAITLNRRDYNIGTGMWKNEDDVAHNVEVKIKIEADK